MNEINLKKAFSLIELSIVIIIIGILVAGVTQSSRLIKRMKILTAQNLTNSSPISSMRDLIFWYETSLDKSFIESEAQDGNFITTWNDISPQNIDKINLLPPASSVNQPKFSENIINGLPALRLDGDDYFNLNGNLFVNTNFTLIMVERKSSTAAAYMLVWTPPWSGACGYNECFHFGYRNDTQFTFDFYASSTEFTSNELMGTKNRIHTMIFDRSFGKKYWYNGGSTPDATQTVANSVWAIVPLLIARSSYFGYGYNGYYSEVIFFNRSLRDEERIAIEDYLSKKYAIKIT